MKLTVHRLQVPLEHEFTIARGSMSTQSSLIVELEHDGCCGFGEVTENRFYGHTFDSLVASLRKLVPCLGNLANEDPAQIWGEMSRLIEGDMFALSALDMAAHDLHGRQRGLPTWQVWGLQWQDVPHSSYTIGIDDVDKMIAKLNAKTGWPVYKIKLGTSRDLEIVRELRQQTDAVFRVDANCGWTPEETIQNSQHLADLNVEFIEQPLPRDSAIADKRNVFENSALPIIADEDCQTSDDIQRCAGLFHGVNVKLCKCGGLTPALSMLREASACDLRTMIGCMVETAVGISGASQLLPLLDYADLDGAVLLKDQPVDGVTVTNGVVQLTDTPGCGARLQYERLEHFQDGSSEVLTTSL